MLNFLKFVGGITVAITSIVFMLIPDEAWLCIKLLVEKKDYINSILNRFLFISIVFLLVLFISGLFRCCRKVYRIKDKNYEIEIRYEDLLTTKRGIHVINFDECFTTKIGVGSGDIKESSLCGQYLLSKPNLNIDELLTVNNIKPEKRKSKYLSKACYKPGTILPYDGDLLMAFAKLDENGQARFDTIEEYLSCLNFFWKQIKIYNGDSDVCIPILGSGKTDFHGKNLSQQEMLDLMVYSYLTSDVRLKKPNKLIICCRRKKDFSLNNIGRYFIK